MEKLNNFLDKISTTNTRAGHTITRIAKLSDAGVSDDVIALQLSSNSANGFRYTADEIKAYKKLHNDVKTKVGITSKQTKAL
ncbi:hypothetical protein K3V08_005013, partial [Escherichia coli]|nr:hypothetical protein [Escherichia coli]